MLPISIEHEAEQDAEIEHEDFEQAVSPSNKDCKSKLLEATKQLFSTEYLLCKATEQLAEAIDQLLYTKSQLLTANN